MESSPMSPKTNIIGLSGPSSSGKTTLARLLREIFNIPPSPLTKGRSISLFIVHEDDFYKTDDQIPLVAVESKENGKRELQDWDCAESVDLGLFERTMQHVKKTGRLPDDMYSKEDKNMVGESGVKDEVVRNLREGVVEWLGELPKEVTDVRLCLLDGFLLYSDPLKSSIPAKIIELLDLKLFLRTKFAQMVQRRGKRSGYVTLEGFWEDPPGYVEEVVWPNYVREHDWMFDGDVDAGELSSMAKKEGIQVGPGKGEKEMEELLRWSVGVLECEIQRSV